MGICLANNPDVQGHEELSRIDRRAHTSTHAPMNESSIHPRGWGYFTGICVFVVGLATPLLIPFVLATELSSAWKGTVSGLLGFGIPEVLMFAGVALMGKPGFQYLKVRMFAALQKMAPPDKVSPARYRCGLVLLGIPVLYGWMAPYVGDSLPWHGAYRVHVAVIGDLLLVIGLIVLGGDFWDKLKALFSHEARVHR
jgi:hypothetical protein